MFSRPPKHALRMYLLRASEVGSPTNPPCSLLHGGGFWGSCSTRLGSKMFYDNAFGLTIAENEHQMWSYSFFCPLLYHTSLSTLFTEIPIIDNFSDTITYWVSITFFCLYSCYSRFQILKAKIDSFSMMSSKSKSVQQFESY